MNVYEKDGEKTSQEKIEALLQKVVSHSQKLGKGPNVGILTSEHRDKVKSEKNMVNEHICASYFWEHIQLNFTETWNMTEPIQLNFLLVDGVI